MGWSGETRRQTETTHSPDNLHAAHRPAFDCADARRPAGVALSGAQAHHGARLHRARSASRPAQLLARPGLTAGPVPPQVKSGDWRAPTLTCAPARHKSGSCWAPSAPAHAACPLPCAAPHAARGPPSHTAVAVAGLAWTASATRSRSTMVRGNRHHHGCRAHAQRMRTSCLVCATLQDRAHLGDCGQALCALLIWCMTELCCFKQRVLRTG
jgi:hypothetical protein